MPPSRGSSLPKDRTCVSYVSCISWQILYHEHHLGAEDEPLYVRAGEFGQDLEVLDSALPLTSQVWLGKSDNLLVCLENEATIRGLNFLLCFKCDSFKNMRDIGWLRFEMIHLVAAQRAGLVGGGWDK